MNKTEYVELGYIAKAHGIRGQLKVVLDVYDLREYLEVKVLYLAKGDAPLKPWRVKSLNAPSPQMILLELDGIEDRNAAEALKGTTIYYPTAALPKLPDGHFYFYEITGFEVEDKTAGGIGQVKEVLDLPNNELLVVDHKGKEVLIPMKEDILTRVDKAAKTVHVDLPEGLLELYTEEGSVEEEEE